MEVRIGDLFQSRAQTIVNTVNTVGVMGKGIALEFKRRFPAMYQDYLERCERGQVHLGEPYIYASLVPPWILNFPTKEHWRSVSRLSDIIHGLEYLERHYKEWGITSLAVPPLGCGQGGLDWRVVGRTLYRHLRRLEIPVELYAPFGTPAAELEEDFLAASESQPSSVEHKTIRLSASAIALAEVLARVISEPHHWPVGRTTFQKLAYFATEAGLPTGMKYERGNFGPFSAGVKPLITQLVNNGVISERRLGAMFSVLPGPTFKDAKIVHIRELENWESVIDRVADLIQRLRTTNQAEIASSVHLVARDLENRPGKPPSEMEVLEDVMRWKQRRRPPLDILEVAMAVRSLGALGWVRLQPSPELPVLDDELLGV